MIMRLLSILLLLFVTSCSSAQNTTISPAEFQKAVTESKVQVLDVRTPEEYKEGFISGALLANWNDQTTFQTEIVSLDKTQPVYIYCRSGKRSAAAQEWMLANGFKNVVNLEGGILAWNAAGLATEKPTSTPLSRQKKKSKKK